MGQEKQSFMKGSGGRLLITAVSAVVIWGLMTFFYFSKSNELVLVVAAVCGFFGWRALNKIQPAMFIWMSWVGWLIYFAIKFLLSVAIGFCITPFILGKKLGGSIHDNMQ